MCLEALEHAGVAEGVLLHARQIQELGHALVGGECELRVDVGRDHVLRDRLESVPPEEVGLEREAEQPRETVAPGIRFDLLEEGVTVLNQTPLAFPASWVGCPTKTCRPGAVTCKSRASWASAVSQAVTKTGRSSKSCGW